MNLIERYEQNGYIVRIPETGCWIWLGALTHGYGYLNQNRSAHKVAYQEFKGSIPAGMLVLHTCDIRCCVNPNHLYLGNHSDNIRDLLERHGTTYLYNPKKDACVRGHSLTTQGNKRVCLICKNVHKITWRNKQRAGGLRVS